MSHLFRRVLCPIDFDGNSLKALETAAELARLEKATVFVLHVLTPVISSPTQAQLDACVAEERATLEQLQEVCTPRLAGLNHEILTRTGDPAIAIIRAAEELNADLLVIACHTSARKAQAFAGSVAERVIRESTCPVLTIRPGASGDPDAVGTHMTSNPLTASPAMSVAGVGQMMIQQRVRSVPVLENGQLVGLLTDRDIALADTTPETAVALLMTREVITVSPKTSIQEAARLLLVCEVDGLPVVENQKLVGIITRSDILRVFAAATTSYGDRGSSLEDSGVGSPRRS